MHLQNFTLGLRLETLALSSADVTIGCVCCIIGPILITSIFTPGCGARSAVALNLQDVRDVVSSAASLLCYTRFNKHTHRSLATPVAYECCDKRRFLKPSLTTELANCRKMCAAPAPAAVSVNDDLAASGTSIFWKMTNDEVARYLDVQMRSLAVWVLEHGHLSPAPGVQIILVLVHIVNTRVRADALQDALHDGLVINLVCFFSAGAFACECIDRILWMSSFRRAVLCQPHVLVDHACRTK